MDFFLRFVLGVRIMGIMKPIDEACKVRGMGHGVYGVTTDPRSVRSRELTVVLTFGLQFRLANLPGDRRRPGIL